MKIYGKRILIRPREKAEETQGDFIMPDKPDETTIRKGFVIAAGDGLPTLSGFEVLYDSYGHTPVEHEGENFHLINEEELLIIY